MFCLKNRRILLSYCVINIHHFTSSATEQIFRCRQERRFENQENNQWFFLAFAVTTEAKRI